MYIEHTHAHQCFSTADEANKLSHNRCFIYGINQRLSRLRSLLNFTYTYQHIHPHKNILKQYLHFKNGTHIHE